MSTTFKSSSKLNFTLKVISLLLLLALAVPSNRKTLSKWISSFLPATEKKDALLHAAENKTSYYQPIEF